MIAANHPNVCTDPAGHGLPAVGQKNLAVRPELFLKDPSGRPNTWYDPMNDETYRLHPDFPAKGQNEQLVVPGTLVIGVGGQPAPAQARMEYLVMTPAGKEVSCPDRETATQLMKVLYPEVKQLPDEVIPDLLETRAAKPTAEEIAQHEAKLVEDERTEAKDILEALPASLPDLAAKINKAVQKATATTKDNEIG